MNREWQEVTLPVPAAWVDLVCEILKEAASRAGSSEKIGSKDTKTPSRKREK